MSETEEEVVPSTEVAAKRTRRGFGGQEKLRILKLADACTKRGEMGALLRSEGLYSSQLADWRKARAAGELSGLGEKKRGPKVVAMHPLEKENAELKRALAKAEWRAKRAEVLVELQKKVAEILGITLAKQDEAT
jgi:transposase